MSEANESTMRRRPTQSRSSERVERILRASSELFVERGYEQTSTNHIVQKLEMSVGALYRYFPNKQAILAELNRRYLREVREVLLNVHQDAQSLSLPAYVNKLFEELIAFCLERPDAIEVFFKAEDSSDETETDDAVFRTEASRILATFFRLREPRLSEADASLIASAIYDVGYVILQTAVRGTDTDKQLVREMKEMILLYLRAKLDEPDRNSEQS